jgi:hypothetical protein
MRTTKATNKADLKYNQILKIRSYNTKGVKEDTVKIIKSVHASGVKFYDGSWMDLKRLIILQPLIIGELKTFLKIFKYRYYY